MERVAIPAFCRGLPDIDDGQQRNTAPKSSVEMALISGLTRFFVME